MDAYEPLRQFLELARTLHFGRAARACHLSPSALSRSIQRLEAELGTALVERRHHEVSVTPAGEALRRHALNVLEDWHRFESERASSKGDLTGTVRVYCTVTAAQGIVPEIVGRVRASHPGIRVELETGYASDAIEQLRSGSIDVSVAALPHRMPSGILSRRLTTTAVIFVGPVAEGPVRDALDRRPVDWSAIPLVLPAHGVAREYVDRWLDHRGIRPTLYSEMLGHEAILSLVTLGCGVGVVPKLVVEKSALRDQVAEVSVRPSLGRFSIGLCVRKDSLSNPIVAAVWQA